MVENGYIFSIGAKSVSSNKHQPAVSTDLGKSICGHFSTAIFGSNSICIAGSHSSIIVKDNSKVKCANDCNIVTGDYCGVEAGNDCRIICGKNTELVIGYSSTVVLSSGEVGWTKSFKVEGITLLKANCRYYNNGYNFIEKQ